MSKMEPGGLVTSQVEQGESPNRYNNYKQLAAQKFCFFLKAIKQVVTECKLQCP